MLMYVVADRISSVKRLLSRNEDTNEGSVVRGDRKQQRFRQIMKVNAVARNTQEENKMANRRLNTAQAAGGGDLILSVA